MHGTIKFKQLFLFRSLSAIPDSFSFRSLRSYKFTLFYQFSHSPPEKNNFLFSYIAQQFKQKQHQFLVDVPCFLYHDCRSFFVPIVRPVSSKFVFMLRSNFFFILVTLNQRKLLPFLNTVLVLNRLLNKSHHES